jgi:hypothetical protein
MTRYFLFQATNLEKVNVSAQSKAPTAETATILIALLDQLIKDCRFVINLNTKLLSLHWTKTESKYRHFFGELNVEEFL